MENFAGKPGSYVCGYIHELIARELVPYGTRFGYVLMLTEEADPTKKIGTEPLMHLVYNGYGAMGSQQAAETTIGILKLAAKILAKPFAAKGTKQ